MKVMNDAYTPVNLHERGKVSKFTSLRSWIKKDDKLQNSTFSDGQREKIKQEAAEKKKARDKFKEKGAHASGIDLDDVLAETSED